MGRIQEIATATEAELDAYLEHLGWDDNPFTHAASLEEYVLPSDDDIAEITSHIRSYTGPILIHSRYSGVGKTTLLRVLQEEFSPDFRTVYIREHNVTPYELVGMVADKLGIGKASSTKLTEQRLREHAENYPQRKILLGVDEFGLNDPDTIHTIQFLNDLEPFHVILTGMSSQWEAIGQLGSDGRAFQRRVSFQLELTPFDRSQATELVQRRVVTATHGEYERWATVDHPFTEDALDIIHDRSRGVPAVITAGCAKLIGLAAYRFDRGNGETVTADLAEAVEYADPEVESKPD